MGAPPNYCPRCRVRIVNNPFPDHVPDHCPWCKTLLVEDEQDASELRSLLAQRRQNH